MFFVFGKRGSDIKIEKFSVAQWRLYMYISTWHTAALQSLSSLILTEWHRSYCGLRSCRFWCRCTHSCGFPACLQILCCAYLALKTANDVIFTNYCCATCYCSVHILMPRKHHSPLLLLSDFGASFLDQVLGFLSCSAHKPLFGHHVHTSGKNHVRLFQLFLTFFAGHSSRNV